MTVGDQAGGRAPLPGDHAEILVRLTKIDGSVEHLKTLINTGDLHTQQLLKLQEGEVAHLRQTQAEDRERHHNEMTALRMDLIRAIEKAELGLSVVRADTKTYVDERAERLGAADTRTKTYVDEHVQRLAASDSRLTSRVGEQEERIDDLESTLNRFKGAALVLGVFVPVLTALLTAVVLKGLGLK